MFSNTFNYCTIGKSIDTVTVFLTVEKFSLKSFSSGVVSIPLLGFSLLAIALIVERIVFWWRVKHRQRRIVKEVLSLYRSDRTKAIDKLKQNAHLPINSFFGNRI